MPGNPTRDLPRMVEQCTAGCANNGGIQDLTYGSQNWVSNQGLQSTWRASASYVTGAQSMKFGYRAPSMWRTRNYFSNNTHLTYRVQQRRAEPVHHGPQPVQPYKQRTRYDALYAQEQWTLGRLTLQGALRYDHAWSYFPEQQVGPVTFLPTPVDLSRRRPASSATTTSRRASAWPTICSATARRR